jgi:hypothetical protein
MIPMMVEELVATETSGEEQQLQRVVRGYPIQKTNPAEYLSSQV